MIITTLPASLKVSLSAAALSFISVTYANDWESSVSIADVEGLPNPLAELNLRYFFTPLHHGGATPWDEVAFVERIGSIGAGAAYTEHSGTFSSTNGSGTPVQFELDRKMKNLKANAILRNADSPHSFHASINYIKRTSDILDLAHSWSSPGGFAPWTTTPPFEYTTRKLSSDAYSFAAGYDYYLARLWTAGAALSYDEASESPSLHVGTDRLWDLGNGRWFGLDASGRLSRHEAFDYRFENGRIRRTNERHYESWGAELNGRYYFNVKTRLDFGAAFDDLHWDVTTYKLGISRYLNDTLFIRLSGSESRNDLARDIGRETDSTTLKLTFGGRY